VTTHLATLARHTLDQISDQWDSAVARLQSLAERP